MRVNEARECRDIKGRRNKGREIVKMRRNEKRDVGTIKGGIVLEARKIRDRGLEELWGNYGRLNRRLLMRVSIGGKVRAEEVEVTRIRRYEVEEIRSGGVGKLRVNGAREFRRSMEVRKLSGEMKREEIVKIRGSE